MPAMLLISISGYAVNWHAGNFFRGASTVSNTLGAMSIGESNISEIFNIVDWLDPESGKASPSCLKSR